MTWCYYIIYMCVHYELTMQRNSNFIWNNEINVVKEYKTNSWWLIKDLTRIWRHHQNLQEFDWVSNWRGSGLNGRGIGDKYKAYGEIRRSNQLSMERRCKSTLSLTFKFASHSKRLWGIKTLLSHVEEAHQWLNSSYWRTFWLRVRKKMIHLRWLRKINWRLMKTNHLRKRTPLKSNQVESKLSKERTYGSKLFD